MSSTQTHPSALSARIPRDRHQSCQQGGQVRLGCIGASEASVAITGIVTSLWDCSEQILLCISRQCNTVIAPTPFTPTPTTIAQAHFVTSSRLESLPRLRQRTAHLGHVLKALPAGRHEPHQHALVLLLGQYALTQILKCIWLGWAGPRQQMILTH
jgi:hypothetical protein